MIRGVRRRARGVRLPVLLALMVLTGAGGAQAWGQEGLSDITIDDPRVSESSGLSVSPLDDGLLYTVNDSGNDPLVFVVDSADGTVVGTTLLEGLDPEVVDPEAMAVQGDTVWVADTGDNANERDDVALYALPAPRSGDDTVRPTAYPVRYAAGHPDVEALLMAPDGGGGGWLVTKEVFGGEVLALPADMRPGVPVTPEPVPGVLVPGLVTDATVLPDGEAAVVRTYGKAFVYRLPDWSQVATIDLPSQQQGETITALADGTTLLAGSEGSPALIDAVRLPPEVVADLERAGPDTDPDASSAPDDAEEAGETGEADPAEPPADPDDQIVAIAAGLAGLIVLGSAAAWLLRRRGGSPR